MLSWIINWWKGNRCVTCCYWNKPCVSPTYKYCKKQAEFKSPYDTCTKWKQRKTKK